MRKSVKQLAALLVKVASGAAGREAKAKRPATSRARSRRKALGLLKKLRNALEVELPRMDEDSGEEIYQKPSAYQCPSCDKRFFIPSNLGRHYLTAHNMYGVAGKGIGDYQCKCGQRFKKPFQLARHLIKNGPTHQTLSAVHAIGKQP